MRAVQSRRWSSIPAIPQRAHRALGPQGVHGTERARVAAAVAYKVAKGFKAEAIAWGPSPLAARPLRSALVEGTGVGACSSSTISRADPTAGVATELKSVEIVSRDDIGWAIELGETIANATNRARLESLPAKRGNSRVRADAEIADAHEKVTARRSTVRASGLEADPPRVASTSNRA